MNIDVIIPVFRPTDKLKKLLKAVCAQTTKVNSIMIMHTNDGRDLSWLQSACGDVPVTETILEQEEFDHGGTRDAAVLNSEADIVILMTQDAIPVNQHLIEQLVKPLLADENIAVSYARQIPQKEDGLAEQYARRFNYPPTSIVKSQSNIERMGIKTYFCSNVCAAYRRETYLELGGFEHPIIFNEDMVYAARAIQCGYKIAYEAEAVVRHSHNYTGIQQLKRNFDLGVSQSCYPEIFENISSESEGIRLVRETARYLIKKGRPVQLIGLLKQSFCKYLGFRLGKSYQKLPSGFVRKLTMNPGYWVRKDYANE